MKKAPDKLHGLFPVVADPGPQVIVLAGFPLTGRQDVFQVIVVLDHKVQCLEAAISAYIVKIDHFHNSFAIGRPAYF